MAATDKPELHILYCGGWGYFSKVSQLQTSIESKVGKEKINFTNTRAAGVTGEFEVTFTKDGNKELIYSKKATGKFPSDDADIADIIKKINA